MTSDAWLLPAGVIAGICNAVAGGGSLLTFPVFLALGYSPYVANVTNAVGVFASNIGAVVGYRRELRTAPNLPVLCGAGMLGCLAGAFVLLNSDEASFKAVVPVLILVGAGLILVQPKLVARLNKNDHRHVSLRWAVVGTAAVSVYGGYFGAAMGVMLLGVYGVFLDEPLQRLNAHKNAVAICVNTVCVVVFALFGPVQWTAALWMTAGTIVGGFAGGHLARRLPDRALRTGMVFIGIVAAFAVALG